jgi:hypothetical protein
VAYFLVRIVVNALAVALTVSILPGTQLAPDVDNSVITILVYLVLGGIFSKFFNHPEPTVDCVKKLDCAI